MKKQIFIASVTKMMSGFLKKIALQVAEAEKHPQEVPLLVYTDLKVVDENLNVQHESMIRTSLIMPIPN